MSVPVHSTSERQAGPVQQWAGNWDSHRSAAAWAGVMRCSQAVANFCVGAFRGVLRISLLERGKQQLHRFKETWNNRLRTS